MKLEKSDKVLLGAQAARPYVHAQDARATIMYDMPQFDLMTDQE